MGIMDVAARAISTGWLSRHAEKKAKAEGKTSAPNVQEQLEREQAAEIARICHEAGDLALAIPLLENGATPADAKALVAERAAEKNEQNRKIDTALGNPETSSSAAAPWSDVISNMQKESVDDAS